MKLKIIVTSIFLVLLVATVAFEATRTCAALSLLWGAFTTNIPVVVVFAYFLVSVALGFFRIDFQRNRNNFRIVADQSANLRRMEGSVFSDTEVDAHSGESEA